MHAEQGLFHTKKNPVLNDKEASIKDINEILLFFYSRLGRPSLILDMLSSWLWHIFKSALLRTIDTFKIVSIGSHM